MLNRNQCWKLASLQMCRKHSCLVQLNLWLCSPFSITVFIEWRGGSTAPVFMPTCKINVCCYTGIIGSCTCFWCLLLISSPCEAWYLKEELGDRALMDFTLKLMRTLWAHVINFNLAFPVMDCLTEAQPVLSIAVHSAWMLNETFMGALTLLHCWNQWKCLLTFCLIGGALYWQAERKWCRMGS